VADNVKAWPKPTGTPLDHPRRIVRPCDYGLAGAVRSLEAQLGTIEAYNRLVEAAASLRAQIDAGNAKPQKPLFAVHITGGQRHG
jgi:hypothetical protein